MIRLSIARQRQKNASKTPYSICLCTSRQRTNGNPLFLSGSDSHLTTGEESRQRLEAVYNRFTEGFETADLRQAKALLMEQHPPVQ